MKQVYFGLVLFCFVYSSLELPLDKEVEQEIEDLNVLTKLVQAIEAKLNQLKSHGRLFERQHHEDEQHHVQEKGIVDFLHKLVSHDESQNDENMVSLPSFSREASTAIEEASTPVEEATTENIEDSSDIIATTESDEKMSTDHEEVTENGQSTVDGSLGSSSAAEATTLDDAESTTRRLTRIPPMEKSLEEANEDKNIKHAKLDQLKNPIQINGKGSKFIDAQNVNDEDKLLSELQLLAKDAENLKQEADTVAKDLVGNIKEH